MSAGDYVITYLNVQIPLADGSVVNTRIRNCNRCYFVGPASAVSPYPMDNYGGQRAAK